MCRQLRVIVFLLAWTLCQEFLLSEPGVEGAPKTWIHHVRALGVYEDECECRVRLKDETQRGGKSWGWKYRLLGLVDPARQVRAICYHTADNPCRPGTPPAGR